MQDRIGQLQPIDQVERMETKLMPWMGCDLHLPESENRVQMALDLPTVVEMLHHSDCDNPKVTTGGAHHMHD
jgi:hypothetical protein